MIRMMRINPPALVLNSFIHLRAGFTTKSAVKQAIATSIVSNGMFLARNTFLKNS